MTVAGRCHGPGCQRKARVEYFCSEPCQAAWSRQVAGLAVNVDVPPGPPTIHFEPVAPFLLAAAERHLPAVREAMRAEVDRVVAETRERARRQRIAHTAPGSVVEDIQRAFDLVRDVQPPERVRLTRDQVDALRASAPLRPSEMWSLTGPVLSPLSGVPIELVETVEESTPYLEQRKRVARAMGDRAGRTHEDGLTPLYQYLPPSGLGAAYPLVASPSPQVAQSGQDRGWLGRLWDRWRQA